VRFSLKNSIVFLVLSTLLYSSEIDIYTNSFDKTDDNESSKTIEQYVSGLFGLKAYHTNYLVISHMDTAPEGDILQEKTNYIKTETKFQISLRGDFTTNLFDSTQIWTGAYTQRSYWQLFVESEPFRETNYMPEAFVTFPLNHQYDEYGIKAISFGFMHQSNGQKEFYGPDGLLDDPSRSWNRLYTKAYFQWNKLLTNIMIWYPISSTGSTNDNADIVDYYGYGLLEMKYAHKKLFTSLNARYNVSTNKGALELEMSYPINNSKDIFYYFQGFTGYGQSLIDYHNYVNQVGFGISLSR